MLILVRHGQSEPNAAGLLVGRSDPPLTALGRDQARKAARLLADELTGGGHPPAAGAGPKRSSRPPARKLRVLTSPLGRARDTAEVIVALLGSLAVPPHPVVEERLIELDYGELEGRRPSELSPELWAAWRADPGWQPPGGESLVQLHARVDPLWASLAAEAASGDVIAVSHVSPIKAAVAWAIGAGPGLAWRLSLPVCSISRVRTGPGTPALVSFGETGHLATTDAGSSF